MDDGLESHRKSAAATQSATAANGGLVRDAYCPVCGGRAAAEANTVLKRGAVTLRYQPIEVHWRGTYIPLTEHEALFFERFMRRGRATWRLMEDWLTDIRWRQGRLAVALFHIRRKFATLGAADPFRKCGDGLVFQAEADEYGSSQVLIGLRDNVMFARALLGSASHAAATGRQMRAADACSARGAPGMGQFWA